MVAKIPMVYTMYIISYMYYYSDIFNIPINCVHDATASNPSSKKLTAEDLQNCIEEWKIFMKVIDIEYECMLKVIISKGSVLVFDNDTK